MDIFHLVPTLLFYCVQLVVLFYLVQPFMLLLLSLCLKKRKEEKAAALQPGGALYHFGIVITAHQDFRLLPPLLDSLLQQTHRNFTVYLVADDCNSASLPSPEDERIRVLAPPVPLHSKTKSIDFALSHFTGKEDVMVILDPDNLLHPSYLERISRYYKNGAQVVQGSLHSKNMDNVYERLDSLGMAFNNFIDRDARSVLNLSANILGCGISLQTAVYRKIRYTSKTSKGGFDKHMQSILVKTVPRIVYAEDAIVYDEKVSTGKTLQRQRIRWINSYVKFLPEAISVFWNGLKRGNGNVSYFGFNLIRPPYSLLLLLTVAFLCVDAWLFKSFVWPAAVSASLFFISFFLILLYKKERGIRAVLMTPVFFYHQVQALFRLRLNKTSFLKTPNHKIIYLEDLPKK